MKEKNPPDSVASVGTYKATVTKYQIEKNMIHGKNHQTHNFSIKLIYALEMSGSLDWICIDSDNDFIMYS